MATLGQGSTRELRLGSIRAKFNIKKLKLNLISQYNKQERGCRLVVNLLDMNEEQGFGRTALSEKVAARFNPVGCQLVQKGRHMVLQYHDLSDEEQRRVQKDCWAVCDTADADIEKTQTLCYWTAPEEASEAHSAESLPAAEAQKAASPEQVSGMDRNMDSKLPDTTREYELATIRPSLGVRSLKLLLMIRYAKTPADRRVMAKLTDGEEVHCFGRRLLPKQVADALDPAGCELVMRDIRGKVFLKYRVLDDRAQSVVQKEYEKTCESAESPFDSEKTLCCWTAPAQTSQKPVEPVCTSSVPQQAVTSSAAAPVTAAAAPEQAATSSAAASSAGPTHHQTPSPAPICATTRPANARRTGKAAAASKASHKSFAGDRPASDGVSAAGHKSAVVDEPLDRLPSAPPQARGPPAASRRGSSKQSATDPLTTHLHTVPSPPTSEEPSDASIQAIAPATPDAQAASTLTVADILELFL